MIKAVSVSKSGRLGQNTLKKDRTVVKALLMISQIGISMIVPIFLGAFLGYRLDAWLGTGFFFLVFLLFGILAAFRNIYKLTKPFYAEDLGREQKEQAYWESLRKERAQSSSADRGAAAGKKGGVLTQDGAEARAVIPDMQSAGERDGRRMAAREGAAARRGREQRLQERAFTQRQVLQKSRREVAEEEFAAWRRGREKSHDGTEDAEEP